MNKRDQIRDKAIEILEKFPDGIRWVEMLKKVKEVFPDFPMNTIQGSLWDMDQTKSDLVFKPARGLWKHAKYKTADDNRVFIPISSPLKIKVKEKNFFQTLFNFLQNTPTDCTKS